VGTKDGAVKSAKAKKPPAKRTPGIPGAKFQAVLRGRQWFVVSAADSLTYGGPYTSREMAQEKAHQLSQNLGWWR
jgi:hypothetical protein